MSAPTVSVVIPFLDPAEEFFREALESVIEQTFRDWELILVDDGSKEAARAVASEYRDRYPERVSIVTHPHRRNEGLRQSRRVGFAAARGRYVGLLDSDDVWTPNKLAEQVALLDRHPSVSMLYGRSLYWRSWQGNGRSDFMPELGAPSGMIAEPPILIPLFLSGSIAVPCPSTMLLRRADAREAGGFEGTFEGIDAYEDQVLLFKMCLRTRALVVDECWLHYRLHDRSMTSRTGAEAARTNRRRFLRWLEGFLHEQKFDEPTLHAAVLSELRRLDQPLRSRLRRFARKWSRRLAGRTIAPELAR